MVSSADDDPKFSMDEEALRSIAERAAALAFKKVLKRDVTKVQFKQRLEETPESINYSLLTLFILNYLEYYSY